MFVHIVVTGTHGGLLLSHPDDWYHISKQAEAGQTGRAGRLAHTGGLWQWSRRHWKSAS